MRKKILALGLALSTMMVCFTGCGEDEKAPLTTRATDESGMTVNEKYVFMASVPGIYERLFKIIKFSPTKSIRKDDSSSNITKFSTSLFKDNHIFISSCLKAFFPFSNVIIGRISYNAKPYFFKSLINSGAK